MFYEELPILAVEEVDEGFLSFTVQGGRIQLEKSRCPPALSDATKGQWLLVSREIGRVYVEHSFVECSPREAKQ